MQTHKIPKRISKEMLESAKQAEKLRKKGKKSALLKDRERNNKMKKTADKIRNKKCNKNPNITNEKIEMPKIESPLRKFIKE